MTSIPVRERTAILQSLGAGVVPAIGLQHIQVGRKSEVEALIQDLQNVEKGGAAVRFVVGRYGSGKTFFLNLIRNVALSRKHVVLQADITTERRLYGTKGEARNLYSELVRNLATRAKPEGSALASLVEKWVSEVDHEVREAGGTEEDTRKQISQRLRPIQDLVSGFDFAHVLTCYYEAWHSQNEARQDAALRWLRGEFATKTEAREALNVRTIIDDARMYDYLKLLAGFVRLAGYKGLLVNVDELVVLSHRLANTTSRNKNFEAILRVINDCLQGHASGISFIFAGTDECLEDKRRGLFSYEALATRLAPNRFATDGRQDWSGPVIKLASLQREECYVLLMNIRRVHAGANPESSLLPDDGIVAYLNHCEQRMGAQYFQTPRGTVKEFVQFLNILDQNRGEDWRKVLGQGDFVGAAEDGDPNAGEMPETEDPDGDELHEFKL